MTTIRSFRLDVGQRAEMHVEDLITKWFDKYSELIPKYAIAREIACKTGKIHYQGLFYLDKDAKFENMKRYWGAFSPSEKSFAPVKKADSYQKYIKKEGNMRFYKGFTEEEIESWGDWEQLSQKQKKVAHRADQYARFIKYLEAHKDIDIGKYKLEWICKQLFEFLGKEPLPEQVNWLKGMCFSAQTKLLNNDTSSKAKKSVEEWVARIIF